MNDKIGQLLDHLVQGVMEIPFSKTKLEGVKDYYEQRNKWIQDTQAAITALVVEARVEELRRLIEAGADTAENWYVKPRLAELQPKQEEEG